MGFPPPLPPKSVIGTPSAFIGPGLLPPPAAPLNQPGLSFGGVFEPPIALHPHQFDLGLNAGFTLVLPGIAFCGISLLPPGFEFTFGFSLPITFPPFAFPPSFFFFISLVCNLSKPFDADFGFGGGRNSRADVDSHPDYHADL